MPAQVNKTRHFWIAYGRPPPQIGNFTRCKDGSAWLDFKRAVLVTCACIADPAASCNACYSEFKIAQFSDGEFL
jgi:hypothetical protein